MCFMFVLIFALLSMVLGFVSMSVAYSIVCF